MSKSKGKSFPALPNIEFLIDRNGEITIGSIASIPCAATASDDHQLFAMLVRRDGESLEQLLTRLDRAIEMVPSKKRSSSTKSITAWMRGSDIVTLPSVNYAVH